MELVVFVSRSANDGSNTSAGPRADIHPHWGSNSDPKFSPVTGANWYAVGLADSSTH